MEEVIGSIPIRLSSTRASARELRSIHAATRDLRPHCGASWDSTVTRRRSDLVASLDEVMDETSEVKMLSRRCR